MKVFLLHRDQDFAVKPELRDALFDAMMSGDLFAIASVERNRERQPPSLTGNDAVLTQDLELETLWNAMSAGDMYDLADSFHARQLGGALFLRAERQPDGQRTFRLTEGEPLPTSYGEDSYRRIFGTAGLTPTATETRR